MTLCPKGLLAGCLTVALATTPAQQTTARPVVTLSRIKVVYPPIAVSARVDGTVTVRVGVRPDGSVSETTLLLGRAALEGRRRQCRVGRDIRMPSMHGAGDASYDYVRFLDSRLPRQPATTGVEADRRREFGSHHF
jgi:hypothetical protein